MSLLMLAIHVRGDIKKVGLHSVTTVLLVNRGSVCSFFVNKKIAVFYRFRKDGNVKSKILISTEEFFPTYTLDVSTSF